VRASPFGGPSCTLCPGKQRLRIALLDHHAATLPVNQEIAESSMLLALAGPWVAEANPAALDYVA
jgi:hypothetical protein